MVEMQGLTIQQLADLYDASNPEVQKWMHENNNFLKNYILRQI